MKILLIDDEPNELRSTLRALANDHEMITATSPCQASFQVFLNKPDLVICDHDLGESSISGANYLRFIQSQYHLPAILFTGTDPRNFYHKDLNVVPKGKIEDLLAEVEKISSRETLPLTQKWDGERYRK